MQTPREPKFTLGQRVRAGIDLVNDGSHPGVPPDAVLAPAGAAGEIVKIGTLVEIEAPIYLVEFEGAVVVGCLEEEIAPLVERSLAGMLID